MKETMKENNLKIKDVILAKATEDITLIVTEDDIDCILEMAGYGCYDWCSEMTEEVPIINGGTIVMYDREDGTKYELTLDKLFSGIKQWYNNGYDEYNAVQENGTLDCGNIDSDMADIIIQFALFNDIIYG